MNSTLNSKLIQIFSVIGDCIIVILSVAAAFFVSGIYTDFYDSVLKYSSLFLALIIFNFIMLELYSPKAENVYNALISVGISLIISYVCVYAASITIGFRYQPVTFWGHLFIFLFGAMLVWRTAVAIAKKKIGEKRTLLIIENMNNTSRLARKLKYASNEENRSWYHLLDENDENEIRIITDELIEKFDAVFISPHISRKTASKILYKVLSLGKDANILANVDGITTLKGKIYQIDDTPVIIKKGIHLSKFQKFIKRGLDIVLSLILGIVTLPAFLLCAIAIKLDSKGPVFYKQERYTIHKKIFNVYKFRTMVEDAEKDGARFASEDDPRITKVGRTLRALRLDELPQIYNILFGSMSFVGPRPERPIFADEFSKIIDSYDMRYCLKAGLTGYAQVYGRYNTRVSDKILMDIIYGTTYSFLLDIKIILLTAKIMFMKSATAGVDEELDVSLSSAEKESERRNSALSFIRSNSEPENREEEKNEENINNYSGV